MFDIWAPNLWQPDCQLLTRATVAKGESIATVLRCTNSHDISKCQHQIFPWSSQVEIKGKAESGAVADFAPGLGATSLPELSESATIPTRQQPKRITMALWLWLCSFPPKYHESIPFLDAIEELKTQSHPKRIQDLQFYLVPRPQSARAPTILITSARSVRQYEFRFFKARPCLQGNFQNLYAQGHREWRSLEVITLAPEVGPTI